MKRTICLVRATLLLLMMLTTMTAWADDSGSCGTSLTYSYVESTHTLTISGTGEMADYDTDPLPWASYKDDITYIEIKDGVTSICAWAFSNCSKLTSVTIGSGVTSIGSGAFCYCNNLMSVTIPTSVTSISNGVFYECAGLTSVTIPAGVTSIGKNAFYGCTGLTSITIPSSVTSISEAAFHSCTGLTSVIIHATSLTTYGECAFENNKAGRKIYVPSSAVDTYKNRTEWYAYKEDIVAITESGNCGDIGINGGSDVTWTLTGTPSNYTLTISGTGEMGNYDISNDQRGWKNSLTAITSIVIESGVTSIGNNAFRACTALTSVTIPASVTSIGKWAFYYCTGLPTIDIPNGVETIDNYAFYHCTSLSAVTIPASVTRIGQYAFYDCTNLARAILPTGLTIIDNCAFQQCTSLASVFIPASVTKVGQGAFNGCTSLATITILTKSLTEFGSNAFDNNAEGRKIYAFASYLTTLNASQSSWKNYGISAFPADGSHGTNIKYSLFDCDFDDTKETLVISGSGDMERNLSSTFKDNEKTFTNVIIENGVTNIGSSAFSECTYLASVTIPNGVTSIGSSAFYDCVSLTSVTIPNSVTSIGHSAFGRCTSLSSVTIPNSVTSFEDFAFYKSGLTSVTIASGVTSIGGGAFEDCVSLTSVTIPNSVTSIGGGAFENCRVLTSVTIPNSVTNIGLGAFEGCVSLTSVTIPASVTSIEDYTFCDCTSLTSVTIPNSVTSIGRQAFYECTSLTSITIPASVTSIGKYAFIGCTSLSSVTIPASVTSIGDDAFKICNNLTTVTIYAPSLTEYGNGAFNDNGSGRKIYVFSDCVETYKSEWSKYANAIEAIPALAVRDAGGELGSWCTYYNGLADVTVAEGTTVYTAKQNNAGGVTLTETGSRVIKRGEAVLLKSADDVVLSSAADSGTGTYTDNELKGVDCETAQDANTTYYVLSKVNGVFGFYKLKNTVNLGANKAYLAVATPPSLAPAYFGFDEGTTNILNTDFTDNTDKAGAWYTLDGRKLQGMPTQKGLYIVNGKKIVIK